MKKIFVVTASDGGWDCVRGVYKAKSEKILRDYLNEERERDTENDLIIHEEYEITEI